MNDSRLDLQRYVPGLVLWLANKLSSGGSRLYRDQFDLGITDWRILGFAQIHPWSTGTQACQLIGLDKAAVSRSFTYLEKRGLIQSRMAGLRKVEYAVTTEGRALYRKMEKVALAREGALLTGFDQAERETMIAWLHRLLDNLEAVNQFDTGVQAMAKPPKSAKPIKPIKPSRKATSGP